tara:strand:- start:7209 stop:8354 length:1146 start_codon:yes stop_codon:yes gene_type:complete
LKKILHIIARLSPGGTELKLLDLIKNTKGDFHHEILVISYSDIELLKLFEEEGVKILNLNISDISSLVSSFGFLYKSYKNSSFNLIVGWLYHGNFFSLLIKLIQKEKSKIIWNIRSSTKALKYSPFHRKIIIKFLKIFSKRISTIIYNSSNSKNEHCDIGIINANNIIIENGIDTNKFKHFNNARRDFCDAHNISPESFIIGISARNHPIKNYDLFLASLVKALEKNPKIICIICGADTKNLKKNFFDQFLSGKEKYEKRVFFLGYKRNMPFYYSVMDLLVLSSYSESSSNAIAESMSCECIAVSTDVGNSKKLINNENFIISDGTQESKITNLAKKIIDLSFIDKASISQIKKNNRKQIKSNYSNEQMLVSFKKIFNDLS